MKPPRFRPVPTLGLVVATLAGLPAVGRAQPNTAYRGDFTFKIVSQAPQPTGVVFILATLDGASNQYGKFKGEVRYLVNPATGTFVGTAFKTTANGDTLAEDLSGVFTATGSEGAFVVSSGTGRFFQATGGGTYVNTWTTPDRSAGRVTFSGSLSKKTAGNYRLDGRVGFTNVQAAFQQGGVVPYLGNGTSPLIGPNTQVGTIVNVKGVFPVDATTFKFFGVVGPNPNLPGSPNIHVIETRDGQIHCTWIADFTLKIGPGGAVFSGNGEFTVVGGTGRYRNATGRFTTVFVSDPGPPTANDATATVQEYGQIQR